MGALNGSQQPPRHHDALFGHLPPVEQNLEVVGRARADRFAGPDRRRPDRRPRRPRRLRLPDDCWDEPSPAPSGGTYIADIRDPANPQEIGFLPAAARLLPRRGRARRLDSTRRSSPATCSRSTTRPARTTTRVRPTCPTTAGGFDLYDVTDPTNPVTLVQNVGDKTPDGSLDPDPDPERLANSYHSVFVWQDGPRAFLVGVDNTEFADVDIFDITDPAEPGVHQRLRPLHAARVRPDRRRGRERADRSSTTTWSSSRSTAGCG